MRLTLLTMLIAASMAACTPERVPPRPVSPSPSTTPSPVSGAVTPQPGLSDEAEKVRGQIITAAEREDYELLRPVLDPEVFLSDFGFGTQEEPDPIARWNAMGVEPLQMMGVLLQMKHEEEETNEGHLFRWPRYDQDTKSIDEISDRDREAFRSIMTRREFERLVPNEEYGYVGPRLGILADGTWWFFLLEADP